MKVTEAVGAGLDDVMVSATQGQPGLQQEA